MGFDTLSKRLPLSFGVAVSGVELSGAWALASGVGFDILSKRLPPAAGAAVSFVGLDCD